MSPELLKKVLIVFCSWVLKILFFLYKACLKEQEFLANKNILFSNHMK